MSGLRFESMADMPPRMREAYARQMRDLSGAAAPAPLAKGSRGNAKYHNERAERAGVRFDSQKEARRYDELMAMLRAGIISDLRLQPQFTFNNTPISRLVELAEADKDGRVVVLPCKVGDTVWIVGAVRKLYSAKVRTFFCGHTSAVRGGDDDGHIHMIRTTECDIPMQKFGKTVFLSREEAEKALQETEGKS